MLTELRVRNLAIIESLTLPLGPGFTVLSGETGAGKSIIVGALGLLLGERSNADVVRPGSDRASVEGVFDVAARAPVEALLDARGIDVEDGRVVIKREVAAGGRARAWINGTPVTAGVLADVGRALVTVHGQHDAVTLLDPEAQRRILDAFADAAALGERVRASAEALATIARERSALAVRRADAERRADYLRHVADEIDGARIVPGEDARLADEGRLLAHAEELRGLAAGIAAALDGDGEGVLSQLAAVQRPVAAIRRIDASLERWQELLDAAYYAIEDLARVAAAYEAAIDGDPARLAEVERRRELLFRIAAKHGGSLDAAVEAGRRARADLDLVDSAAFDLAQLDRRESAARTALAADAARLTAARTAAATSLAQSVDALLPTLGLADGHFVVALPARAEIGPTGAEDVEFRVALNVGHEVRSLARVASGGELSRVMLALETILARVDRVPTLVFDEVDAGIGGRVALQVGDAMRRVAGQHQVLAITHLAQIAARAHAHVVVRKGARGGVTTADVAAVDGEARVGEIARMLGGDPERAVSQAHARELLRQAADGAPATSPAAVPASRSRTAARRRE
jgi:DNA repair protein RecN (Recombination protein N)